MKKIALLAFLSFSLLISMHSVAQNTDKSKRPSPPADVAQKLKSGAIVTIYYSQPSLKGRVVGETVEPMKNEVWRMGANEATVFEASSDVMVEGKSLAAGKYAMFGMLTDEGFKIMFNSNATQWGTQYDKNKDKDVLTITVKPRTVKNSQERLTYLIDASGKVTLLWGTFAADFNVK